MVPMSIMDRMLTMSIMSTTMDHSLGRVSLCIVCAGRLASGLVLSVPVKEVGRLGAAI